MKISCDIIRDILPLYAEDMVSDATKEMVNEHLCECKACASELETIKKPRKLPVEADVKSLKRVGDSIRRRRILSVMAVFLFIATVLLGGALMLDATIYLSAGEAVEDIYVEEDSVRIIWNDQVIGNSANTYTEDSGNYAVTAWTNLYKILFPAERVHYEELSDEIKDLVSEEQYEMFERSFSCFLDGASDKTNFWYYHPGKSSMTLILNAEQLFPEDPMMQNDPYCLYYVIGMAAMGILCFLGSQLSKGKWYGELAGRIFVVLVSLSLSVVVVTAGQFSGLEGHFHEALIDSTVVALPMALFGLCMRQLIQLNRKDKGL